MELNCLLKIHMKYNLLTLKRINHICRAEWKPALLENLEEVLFYYCIK